MTLPNPENPCVTLSSDNPSQQRPSETSRISWPCDERWLCAPEEVQLKRALSIEWRHTAASIRGGTMRILCGAESLKSVSSAHMSAHMMNTLRPRSRLEISSFGSEFRASGLVASVVNGEERVHYVCLFLKLALMLLLDFAPVNHCLSHTNYACYFLSGVVRLGILPPLCYSMKIHIMFCFSSAFG